MMISYEVVTVAKTESFTCEEEARFAYQMAKLNWSNVRLYKVATITKKSFFGSKALSVERTEIIVNW